MPSASASEDQAPGRLSVTRVWRGSTRSFLAEWPRLLVLSVLIEIPVLVFELLFHPTGGGPRVFQFAFDEGEDVFELGVDALVVGFYVSLGHHLLVGVIERMVGAEREGHQVPPLGRLILALPWWKLIVADVVLAVAINIGLVALIVPGVLAAVWFAFVPVVLSFQSPPIIEAFRRSRAMVAGNFWPVFWVTILALAANGLIGEVIGALLGALVHAEWMESVAHTLPSALLAPIFALPVVVAFFDLRALRGEGG